jgi:Uncharacterised protein family (UPF0158)
VTLPNDSDTGPGPRTSRHLDLEEIATALSDQESYEHRWLINAKNGEILFWTTDTGIDGQNPVDLDDLDPDLILIDPLPSRVWYTDMDHFAYGVSDEQAQRRLTRAIEGRGAFRRFKDELHQEYPDLVPVWNAFRDSRAKRRAIDWLVDNGLVTNEEGERMRADHPEPPLP